MARGGRREGAGGKYKWIHGETKVVRVPVALSDQILTIAKILDEGKSLEDVTQSKTIDLSGISVKYLKNGPVVYLQDLLKAGYKIRPIGLISRLRKQIDKGIYPE